MTGMQGELRFIIAGAVALALLAWFAPRTAPGRNPAASPHAAPHPRPESSPVATVASVIPAPTPTSPGGTWSARDNHGRAAARCDPASSITFLSNGQYLAAGERGRYSVAGATIILSDRVLYDIDAGEDLSQFAAKRSFAYGRPGAAEMTIGANRFFRCSLPQ